MLGVLALVTALVPLSTGIAAGEECRPFTRSDLAPRPSETTTTTGGTADLLGSGRARGVQGDDEGGGDTIIDTPPPDIRQPNHCQYVYEMEFPVLGAGQYWAGFGAPRDGGSRSHMGIDIMAPQMTPVVAAFDGVVSRIEIERGTAGNYVAIDHDDGWSSWYMHLNNDSYGTDDGKGIGIRPDLAVGDEVTAGEIIGWVGDSGNAETTAHHLHFELHMPDGEPIDAYDSLEAAQSHGALAFAIDSTRSLTDGDEASATVDLISARVGENDSRPEFHGPFVDDDGREVESTFGRLTAMGIRTWCDDWGVRVCPDEPVDGADAEAWIRATISTGRDPSVAIDYRTSEVDPGLDRSEVVACGVNILCPDEPASYGEIAAMLIGASDGSSVLTPREAAAVMGRVDPSVCGAPLRADRTLTRGDFALLLTQIVDGAPGAGSCSKLS